MKQIIFTEDERHSSPCKKMLELIEGEIESLRQKNEVVNLGLGETEGIRRTILSLRKIAGKLKPNEM